MIDTVRWRILLVALAGWVNFHQLEVIAYLREENRALKEPPGRPTPASDRSARILICDRDAKWSAAFRQTLAEAGIRVVQTPYCAPKWKTWMWFLTASVPHRKSHRDQSGPI